MFGKKKKDDKLSVEIVTINKGQPTEHYVLAEVEKDGKRKSKRVLSSAPNWKTKSGAARWAEKNGYKLVEASAPKKVKTVTPKTSRQKPASKRTEPKPDETVKPVKKREKRVVNQLIHCDREEMQESQITPVILNLGGIKAKPLPKVLRRVAKTGGYTAWDDVKRSGKTFATEKEAKDYAADLLKKTGKVVLVSPTDRQVTHSFKPEEKINKK